MVTFWGSYPGKTWDKPGWTVRMFEHRTRRSVCGVSALGSQLPESFIRRSSHPVDAVKCREILAVSRDVEAPWLTWTSPKRKGLWATFPEMLGKMETALLHIATVALQPKIASTRSRFVPWCDGGKGIVTWGVQYDDDFFRAKHCHQLRNVQQICVHSICFCCYSGRWKLGDVGLSRLRRWQLQSPKPPQGRSED